MSETATLTIGTSELIPGGNYYMLRLLADKEGHIVWDAFTSWAGFVSKKPLIERRVPSAVIPQRMISLWQDIGIPYIIVSDEKDLYLFLVLGGCALIEESILYKNFSNIIEDQAGSRPYGNMGFISAEKMPETASFRAPTPRLRMSIIKRDGYRCRICGRRPTDYEDIELHVHHIRPWKSGGATLDDNLITLCGTCHRGLDPHHDPNLYEMIGIKTPTITTYVAEHFEGILRYRELTRKVFQSEKAVQIKQ